MKAVPPGLWLPVVIISIIGLFIAPGDLNAQSAKSGSLCKCEDVDELIREHNTADSDILSIAQLWLKADPTEKADENSPFLSYFIKVKVAKSDCLKYVFDIYNAKLKAIHIRYTTGKGLSYRDYIIKVGRALDDIIASTLKRLNGITDEKCRPGFWFGNISYSFIREMHSNQDRPADGVKHTIENSLTINGGIKLDGKFSDRYPSFWDAGGKFEEIYNSSGMRPCKGGLRQEGDKHKYETNNIFTYDNSGVAKDKETEVGIGEPEDDKIWIQFRIPEITVQASGYKNSSYKTDCPKPNGDFDGPSEPYNTTFPLSSQSVNFQADYHSLKHPSISYEEILGQNEIESGITGTVKVYYSLLRLKPLR